MIMVSGASGQLGRLTVGHLLQAVDASRVVALSRTPDEIADLGVETRFADFDDPGSLAGAFDGAERLLVISVDALGGRLGQHTNAIEGAVKAGVGQVIYTSVPRAGDPGNPVPVVRDHQDTERVLAAAGVPFTVLRFNVWVEMLDLIGVSHRAVATGVLPSNAGAGRVGHLTRDDSAAVAAAVLANGGHQGQFLEVTGPAAVTDAEIAAALAEATGRPVRHKEVSDREIAGELAAQGIPAPVAEAWGAGGAARREGWFDITTHAVERLTGRRPTSVAEYFAAHPPILS